MIISFYYRKRKERSKVTKTWKETMTTTSTTKKQQTTTTTTTTFQYEFGGPIGALATMIALPVVVMCLSYWTRIGYLDIQGIFSTSFCSFLFDAPIEQVIRLLLFCSFGLIGWMVFVIVLWATLPGPTAQGAPIHNDADNGRLDYQLNGHATFWAVVVLVAILQPIFPLNEYLFRYYEPLAFMASCLSAVWSIYLYYSSFYPANKFIAKGGDSGVAVYDLFIGRELNPRWDLSFIHPKLPTLDLKYFCELRPGLIGWMLLNFACMQEQYAIHGTISGSMWFINISQAFYVWDALYHERSILTTMDITTDGFGFMLCFGDLAWVPFTYTVPAKFLVHHDPQLSTIELSLIIALYAFGFYIFRSSNGQKDMFRRDPKHPSISHLQYMPTKRGTKLLVSGWWGMARKINYTGDYLMGLTYSLVCGYGSIIPYYYAIYFAILLIHRSIRDDEMCHRKYGSDWIEYKRQVPYRFIPGIL